MARVFRSLSLALLIVLSAHLSAFGIDDDFPLDVDLSDRADPVPPGGELVYEIEVENFTPTAAAGTVVTGFLPEGTEYVAAYREPDWSEVPAELGPGFVRWDLGDLQPCDQPLIPRCRDLWVTLRVDETVAPGTVLEYRVEVEASDSALYPTNSASVLTTVGSLVIGSATLRVGRPGGDSLMARLALGRSGTRSRWETPTPTIDPSEGVSLRIGAPGEAPWLDIVIPANHMRCSGNPSNPVRPFRCKLLRSTEYRAQGLRSLTIRVPPPIGAQRGNPRMKVVASRLTIGFPEMIEIDLESGGVLYSDDAPLRAGKKRRRLFYDRNPAAEAD